MACEDQSKRNCFTVIWKVENVNYLWRRDGNYIESPAFSVDEIRKTNWKLRFDFLFYNKRGLSNFCLERLDDANGLKNVRIDYELAFLSSDGKVTHSFEGNNALIEKNGKIKSGDCPSWYDVLFEKRSVFLSQDSLTVRCRMWKSVGEMSKNVRCFARTRLVVEKQSFLWNIENCNNLESDEKNTYHIKSLSSGEELMTLEFCFTGGRISNETMRIKISPDYENLLTSTIQVSIVDAFKNTVKCFQDEFCNYLDDFKSKECTLSCTKRELLKSKNTYLPNDTLSLLCEYTYSTGKFEYEIEFKSSNYSANENPEHQEANELATQKDVFINEFRSMLNNSELSDVQLKTQNKTYPAHKFILGVRSPVFKAMFSNNMKENISNCVNIDDFSDETVLDLLMFIYCAEVEELDYDRATHLYEVADKYQILNLKDISASYLKMNVSPKDACKTLVLADLHQDENLKRFVQDFILKDGEEIVNSEEWEKLMKTHLKLAAETLCLRYKVEVI